MREVNEEQKMLRLFIMVPNGYTEEQIQEDFSVSFSLFPSVFDALVFNYLFSSFSVLFACHGMAPG